MDDKRDIEVKSSEEIEASAPEDESASSASEEEAELNEDESRRSPGDIGESTETDETEQLRQKVAELEDKLLRSHAEFDNYRKRALRQQEQAVASAREGVITELLEIVDNFERAAEHAEGEVDATALKSGMEMIYNQLRSLLRRYDVTPVESVGRPFDPSLHEALMQVESDEHPDGTVVNELTRGYKVGDRVLRYAKVGVSRDPRSKDEGGEG